MRRPSITYCSLAAAVVLVMLASVSVPAQNIRYRDSLFSAQVRTADIPYGEAGSEVLLLDFYAPAGDTATGRPLVLFFHGGGFRSNDKVGSFSALLCSSLTKRGYAVASANYRLAKGPLQDSTQYFTALYLAQQDARAAVRFFRKHAVRFAVNPDRIIVTGTSAGAKIALHLAYMQAGELPGFIDTTTLGGIEGNSGNPGYAAHVFAVINFWGALWNLDWLQRGDVPLYSVHGVNDQLVPYDSAFSYHGFRYGSVPLYARARALGVHCGLRTFYNAGHTLDNNKALQDSAVTGAVGWLFGLLKQNGTATGLLQPAGQNTGSVSAILPRGIRWYH